MTNSKLIRYWTQVRGTFDFELVQTFTDFVTWQIAKAYKEWSIRVKRFFHFRGRYSFIIKIIKNLYLQRNTGRTLVLFKTGYLTTLKTISVHETNSYMCVAAISITFLGRASCVHVSGLATRTEMEAVPSFFQSLIYQPRLVVNITAINYFYVSKMHCGVKGCLNLDVRPIWSLCLKKSLSLNEQNDVLHLNS